MDFIPIALRITSKGSASDLYRGLPNPTPVARIIIIILVIINPYILRGIDCKVRKSP